MIRPPFSISITIMGKNLLCFVYGLGLLVEEGHGQRAVKVEGDGKKAEALFIGPGLPGATKQQVRKGHGQHVHRVARAKLPAAKSLMRAKQQQLQQDSGEQAAPKAIHAPRPDIPRGPDEQRDIEGVGCFSF